MTSATSIPSNDEIEQESDAIRKAILSGMQRILLGQPRTVAPGADTFSHLAVEAQVKRHHLYQRHPDLKDRFEFLRDQSARRTDLETELEKRVEGLKIKVKRLTELQTTTRTEARHWRSVSETFARAINVLQEELRREQVTTARLAKKLKSSTELSTQSPVVHIRPSSSAVRLKDS